MQPMDGNTVSGTGGGEVFDDARSSSSGNDILRHLPVALIDPCPNQPRQRMAPRPLEELIASVRQHGVLQPIRVRPRGERYEIVAGERRWTAARVLGLHEIPAVITDVDDEQAGIQALVENIHREDLTLIDRAQALVRLRRSLGLTSWEAVGNRLGLSKSHVTRLLNVTRLADQIREDARLAELTEKHVRALYGLRSNHALQIELWELIHQRGLSGDDALRRGLAMRVEGDGGASATIPAGDDHVQADDPEQRALRIVSALDAAVGAVDGLTPDELDALRERIGTQCVRMRQILERGRRALTGS
jgi:ParB/RepB/Spo0J family partition protein